MRTDSGSAAGGGDFVLNIKDALGHDHFEFVDLAIAGVFVARFVKAVEDLGAVQIDFQAALVGGRQFDGNVAGVLRAPEFGRQPRGESVVASRDAVDNFKFHFAELGTGHSHKSFSRGPVVEQGDTVGRPAYCHCGCSGVDVDPVDFPEDG